MSDAELDRLVADAEADPARLTQIDLERLERKTRILCGFVELPDMTQRETDWLFRMTTWCAPSQGDDS